jgi:Carboxylesterase family
MDATPDSKLPVWFYIQGGGYVTNSNANYNGTKVIEESGGKIVVVNFNYRVSAYGFLASEKVRRNGNLNAGLLDQRKALEWVQKYISLVIDLEKTYIKQPAHTELLMSLSVRRGSRPCSCTWDFGRRRLAGSPSYSVWWQR